jgi:hypothetical protein
MGTLSNGRGTVAFENANAPGLDWHKAGRTDLDPIVKDCVILAAAPDAKDHPHDRIPDGTRMVAISDDKDTDGPVLFMSRVEISKFFDGVLAGEFDHLRASEEELAAALEIATAV